jgi:centromere protein C
MRFLGIEADLFAGNTYSIKNVGSTTAHIFFAQARESFAGED